MVIYTPDHLESIVNTFNTWFPSEDGQNPKACFFLGCVRTPQEFAPALVAVVFYDGYEAEGRRIFKPFLDLNPIVDLTCERPYVEQVTPHC